MCDCCDEYDEDACDGDCEAVRVEREKAAERAEARVRRRELLGQWLEGEIDSLEGDLEARVGDAHARIAHLEGRLPEGATVRHLIESQVAEAIGMTPRGERTLLDLIARVEKLEHPPRVVRGNDGLYEVPPRPAGAARLVWLQQGERIVERNH